MICYESDETEQVESDDSILPYGKEFCINEKFYDSFILSNIFSVRFTSIPFLIATFLVYIGISELRNLHGKCFLCYLVCLTLMYTLSAFAALNGTNPINKPIRKAWATCTYFATLSAFLWLNVISFDLWSSFR